ncbi:MAG: hypothetical protein E7586_04735 [Ruminococcaceae bacterium]|nr:hypothetical protein [Oscillospiraceae bacterium]
MIALKIIGISFAVIILIITVILLSRAKLIMGYTEKKGFEIYFGFWFLKFKIKAKDKKKKKKSGRFAEAFKKRLGLDVFDTEELKNALKEGGISAKITQIAAIIMLFAERIKWFLSKLRGDKLCITAVCGGDSADAAIEYGLVCATVYPLSTFVLDKLNLKKNAESIKIGCDFDGDSYFEFQFVISVKIYHLLKVAVDCLSDLAVIAEKAEVLQNERRD